MTVKMGAALALVLGAVGCSITSTPANVDHMQCIHAHDEVHSSNGNDPVTVCDEYVPTPLPTVTVTVTATP